MHVKIDVCMYLKAVIEWIVSYPILFYNREVQTLRY